MPTTIVSGGSELLNPEAILRTQLGVKQGQIVASFGCGGAGFFVLAAARLVGDHGQVYAVDIVKQALSSVDGKAKLQGLYNVKTVWSDLEMYGAMDIPEQSLDHGLLINVLFQSKQHQDILKEVSRLVKSGGKLLIIDWNDQFVSFGPPKADRVDPESLRTMVPPLGYLEEKVFQAGQYHFGLIFTRV
jgi:ubiquinone/menaquinone biosynthesis C-methylase UbiE